MFLFVQGGKRASHPGDVRGDAQCGGGCQGSGVVAVAKPWPSHRCSDAAPGRVQGTRHNRGASGQTDRGAAPAEDSDWRQHDAFAEQQKQQRTVHAEEQCAGNKRTKAAVQTEAFGGAEQRKPAAARRFGQTGETCRCAAPPPPPPPRRPPTATGQAQMSSGPETLTTFGARDHRSRRYKFGRLQSPRRQTGEAIEAKSTPNNASAFCYGADDALSALAVS